MRTGVDTAKLMRFMDEIGKRARGPGRIYLVGGSTMLLLGVRNQTIDVDIKLHPEPAGVFEAIAKLKDELGLNVELASPDDFLPALPGWESRSEFIKRCGQVDFYHYDYYGQCLAKVMRWHTRDISDAKALVTLGKVVPGELWAHFEGVRPEIIRYPSVDPVDLEERLAAFVREL
jgi:hypothetical protein